MDTGGETPVTAAERLREAAGRGVLLEQQHPPLARGERRGRRQAADAGTDDDRVLP